MKLYLHFEGVGGPDFSMVQEINEKSLTFIDLLNNFVSVYNTEQPGLALTADDLCMFSADGRKWSSLSSQVVAEVSDKDDIIVMRKEKKTSHDELAAESAINGNKLNTSNQLPQLPLNEKSIRLSIFKKDVGALMDARNFRKARLLCEKYLETKSEESWFFLGAIARIKLGNNQIDAAVNYAKKAVAAAGAYGYDTNDLNLTLARALCLSTDAYDEAEEILEKLQSRILPVNHQKTFMLDVRTLRAECLFDLNQHEAAANLVNEHMNWEGALDHLPTLVAYSRFAMTYRKVEEPLRAILKGIVIDQKSAKTCKMLAELLSSSVGYSELNRQVPPTLVSASAYAYLAMAVKECSAIDPCIRLLSEALRLKPQSASFALNLCHAHEIMGDYEEALLVVSNFCSANRSLKVGLSGFTGADILAVLKPSALEGDYPAAVSLSPGVLTLNEAKQSGDVERSRTAPVGAYAFADEDREDATGTATCSKSFVKFSTDDMDFLAMAFTTVKISYLAGKLSIIPALHRLIEPTRQSSLDSLHLTSIRNESAYYRCVINVLAHRGIAIDIHGPSEPPVISNSDLKGTFRPSESAANHRDANSLCDDYWSDKLFITPMEVHEASRRPIYIVGDSHCMSLAWSIIRVDERRQEKGSVKVSTALSAGTENSRLLVPRLVTGLKQWHLRNEGTFYPKANFHHAIEGIPSGSDVVFNIGEIDVREGFWKSLERDRYDSLAEGMERTVDIYTKVLLKILATKNFNIFIHPIAPVLDETRVMVKQFNSIFERKVRALKGLHWMQFFPELLNASQNDLNSNYKMDGTHLSPNYLSLVESALQKHYN